jgi:hypothetical protein
MRFIHTLYFTASAFCFIAAPSSNAAIGETQSVEIVCSNGKGPTAEEESKCLRQLKAGLLEDYLATADPARANLLAPLRDRILANPDSYLDGFTKAGANFDVKTKRYTVSGYTSIKYAAIDRLIDQPTPGVKRNPILFIFVARRQSMVREHGLEVSTSAVTGIGSQASVEAESSSRGAEASANEQVRQGVSTSSSVARKADSIVYQLEKHLQGSIDRSFSEVLVNRQYDVAPAEELFDESNPESNLEEMEKDFATSADFSVKHRKKIIDLCREKAPILAYGTLTLLMKRQDPRNAAITLIDVGVEAQVLDCRGAVSIKVGSVGRAKVTGSGADQSSAELAGIEIAAAMAANKIADQLRSRGIQ